MDSKKRFTTEEIERDRLIDIYVKALDDGHLEDIEPVLNAALTDPILDHAISEINKAYAEELEQEKEKESTK